MADPNDPEFHAYVAIHRDAATEIVTFLHDFNNRIREEQLDPVGLQQAIDEKIKQLEKITAKLTNFGMTPAQAAKGAGQTREILEAISKYLCESPAFKIDPELN